MATKKKDEKAQRYIAVRQLVYPHANTGKEITVAPGKVVHDMAEESLALEIEAGNVVAEEDGE